MSDLFSQVKNEKAYIIELRRHFHQYPEPSFMEFETAKKIEEVLSGMGIPHKRIGETGVLGIISGEKPGKVIALRADTDALPIQEENDVPYRSKNNGVMHACGHDGHTAALLGAAKVLMANRARFSGEVRLFFQQAEEAGGGSKDFIQAGALNGAGRVFGIHMAPDMEAGKISVNAGPQCASVDHFLIGVKGKSAHISTPHKGADALYAACQIVNALQGIVTRRISALETVVIGVGKLDAGTTYNIIAEKAVMEGTLRTFSAKLREELKGRIAELSSHIAAVSGTESEITWKDYGSVLVNDDTSSKEAAEIAASIGCSLVKDRPPILGGDDFSEFLLAVPGSYAFIGCKDPAKPGVALHNCRFYLDEDALVYAAGMYSGYAMWYLTS